MTRTTRAHKWLILAALLVAPVLADESTPTGAEAPAIIGPVDDGSPVPAALPTEKPAFQVQSTAVRELADRKVVIHRVTPPTLPVAEVSTVATESSETLAQSEVTAEPAAETHFVALSATVYGHQKSLVRWWHEGQEYTAWSRLDFAHFGGFGSYRANGREQALLLSVASVDSAQQPEGPSIPTDGPGYVSVGGDAANAGAVAVIQGLHDLYQVEGERLKLAYEGRERARLAKEAADLANPPQPKETVIHFWKRPVPAVQPTPTEGDAQ